MYIISGIIILCVTIYYIEKFTFKTKPEIKDSTNIELEKRIILLEHPPKFKKGDKVGLRKEFYNGCYHEYLDKIIHKGKVVGYKFEFDYKSGNKLFIRHNYEVKFGNDLAEYFECRLKKL